LEALASIQRGQEDVLKNNPSWVKKAREFLHDQSDESISLTQLAQATGIHPGHLSRDFSRYFYCSFGEYIRKIKIEQSLPLISNQQQTLTDIAFTCGFADQSHFIRCFKAVMGISPLAYRKMLRS
ncbi:MAG TPA: AraC family transcriptional regulator, partial [Haliscomenobacter sp.]|nr:AraC family transcriptional regulator [Haliscomenobacter sp.]